jgi:hypothetical protein
MTGNDRDCVVWIASHRESPTAAEGRRRGGRAARLATP